MYALLKERERGSEARVKEFNLDHRSKVVEQLKAEGLEWNDLSWTERSESLCVLFLANDIGCRALLVQDESALEMRVASNVLVAGRSFQQ